MLTGESSSGRIIITQLLLLTHKKNYFNKVGYKVITWIVISPMASDIATILFEELD